jgi:hypothetical protein
VGYVSPPPKPLTSLKLLLGAKGGFAGATAGLTRFFSHRIHLLTLPVAVLQQAVNIHLLSGVSP